MRIILIAIAVLALAGCARTAPLVNVNDSAVTPTTAKSLSASDVRKAIIVAGTSLNWSIKDAGPGKMEGTLHLREHTAVVEIPYSSKSYSIIYKRSDNLQASADGSTIHSNYNSWVQNLDRAIRTEISRH